MKDHFAAASVAANLFLNKMFFRFSFSLFESFVKFENRYPITCKTSIFHRRNRTEILKALNFNGISLWCYLQLPFSILFYKVNICVPEFLVSVFHVDVLVTSDFIFVYDSSYNMLQCKRQTACFFFQQLFRNCICSSKFQYSTTIFSGCSYTNSPTNLKLAFIRPTLVSHVRI